MLLFTFLLKYDVRTASGNAKLTLIVSNYTALLSYILSGNVFYMIAIPCAVSNVLGNYIGAGFAIKNGREDHPAGDDLRGDGADRENCSWKVN